MRLLDNIQGRKNRRSAAQRGRTPGKAKRRPQPAATVERMESRTLLSATLDSSFGSGGMVMTDFGGTDQAQTMLRLSDGRMLVAGRTTVGTNADFAIARYNADGSLDASFGVGGRVITDLGSLQEGINAMTIDADGKLVVAGEIRTDSGFFDFVVARYNTDGTLDTSFGAGGFVITDFAGDFDVAYDVLIQSDGRILVAGTASSGAYRMGVARYNTDGSLDATFDLDGKTMISYGDSELSASAIALTPDGQIVLGGYEFNWMSFEASMAMARLNADGSLDTTFGAGGVATANFVFDGEQIYDLLVTSSGEIIAAGEAYADFAVAKFDATGAPVMSFGSGGVVVIDVAQVGYNDVARSVAVDADGRIYAAGSTMNDAGTDMIVVRLNADGTLDSSFDDDGMLIADLGSTDDIAVSLAQDGQTLLLGGSTYRATGESYDFAMVRYVLGPSTPANLAPIARPGGPYSVEEGRELNLDGSGSTDADGVIVSYEWDFNYDGLNFDVDASGMSPSFSAIGVEGPNELTIALRVTDDLGASHVHITTITVTNAAPSVTLTGDASGVRGQVRSLEGGFTDPGMYETHEFSWDFGDGTVTDWQVATGSDLFASHVWTAAGTYEVTLYVRDQDGAVSSDTHLITINVFELQERAGGEVDLVVGGTTGSDVIEFTKYRTSVALYVNNEYMGAFSHSGRLIAFGQAGDDLISARGLFNNAFFHGDDGNDNLAGGKGDDTLVGDAGADVYSEGGGSDVIISDADDPIDAPRGKGNELLRVTRDMLRRASMRGRYKLR